jgi:integrase
MPRLSAKSIAALLPPPKGRLELVDTEATGLRFRLSAKGAASWSLQVNVDGDKRRFTVGEYPAVGLSKAREEARRLRAEALSGHDPIRAKRDLKAKASTALTTEAALVSYAALHLADLRSAEEREIQLRSALDAYLDRPIAALARSELQGAIDAKAGQGHPVAANRLRAALSHFAGWCWRRGHIPDDIGRATSKAMRERPRERVLSLGEVRIIQVHAEAMGAPWAAFLQLLLLTAQRRGDVAGMLWEEVDLPAALWSIPGLRSKNRKAHAVHLSAPALEILNALHVAAGRPSRGLVFTTTGKTPVSGFNRVKLRLDAALTIARIEAGHDAAEAALEHWRLHDFRTAFASHLADAGEAEGVVDRVLNHVASASSASAVARVYNRAELLPQRRAALDAWASMVTSEVSA